MGEMSSYIQYFFFQCKNLPKYTSIKYLCKNIKNYLMHRLIAKSMKREVSLFTHLSDTSDNDLFFKFINNQNTVWLTIKIR